MLTFWVSTLVPDSMKSFTKSLSPFRAAKGSAWNWEIGDLWGICSGSRGLNLVVRWTFPSFELFLGKALFEQIFWNIKLFQIFDTLLYNIVQYFRTLTCCWSNNWVYKYPQVAPECVRGEVLSRRRGFRLLSLRTAGCCPPKIREEGIDGVCPRTI